MADLTYNIVEQLLTGSLDGKSKIRPTTAYSGGRAGSTQHNVVNSMLANNPFGTSVMKVKKGDTTIGGPLPMGLYELKTYEKKEHRYIRLNPIQGTHLAKRGGFLIHGRGPRGSDGCIVPHDAKTVGEIYDAVQNRERAKRPPLTLEVVATGDIETIERNMQTWSHTA